MKKHILSFLLCIAFLNKGQPGSFVPFSNYTLIDSIDIPPQTHHLNHEKLFSKYAADFNKYILKAIDIVQNSAIDGGGYFIGIDSVPTESPIGYELKLFEKSLLKPTRTTSYCSGSTFAVFIEAINLILHDQQSKLSEERFEAIRMQEPNGGRREDRVKFWGKWNDDGFGSQYALVQYSGMGTEINPKDARPGDFMNISWKKGGGHSVIFLGWFLKEGIPGMIFFSSQRSTNGLGDIISYSLDNIKEVKIVRLTNPENIFTFNINNKVNRQIPGDKITEIQ